MSAITILPDSTLIVGGGDGKVKKLIYEEGKHFLTHEILLPGKVMNLSLTSDGKEAICGTSNGQIYRVLLSDLTFTLHNEAHCLSVNACTYGKVNDSFIAVDDQVNRISNNRE